MKLSTFFLAEQSAFLRRRNREWKHHLRKVQAFIGESLQRAPRDRPVLILGAGSGLEVPWNLAPPDTTGWDLDPTSRVRTLLRWGCWPAWVFQDLTGSLEALRTLARRSVRQAWSGRTRDRELAARRLAGLMPSLQAKPVRLQQWLEAHRPSLVVSANWMGQLGSVAQRMMEQEFGTQSPWEEDPELRDPLAEALECWTRQTLQTHLQVLRESGAELCLIYDRAVIQGSSPIQLGPFEHAWTRQLQAASPLDLIDPLPGLEPGDHLPDPISWERWLWTISPEQRHLVEALAWRSRIHTDSLGGMK